MTQMGIRILDYRLSARDFIEIGKLAEAWGVHSIWIPEPPGSNAIAHLTALAISTSSIKLATGILTVFLRPPALVAGSLNYLDQLSGGRAILGLGSGHLEFVQTKQGVPFDRPFGRMREYVQVVRTSHRGEPVDHAGPIYPMQGFRCEFASVQQRIPIYLAALGPQMLRLAGEIADGALLNWRPPEFIPAAVEEVHQGARQAGRQPQEVDIACFLRVSVLSQGQPLPDQLRTQVVTYMQHPFYNKQFKDYGFGQVVREATQCLSQGDTAGAVEKVPDEMIRSLIAVGTPQQCWERIQQYIKAGVQTPVIAPVPIGPDPLRGWLDTINALADHLPDPALLAARG